MSISLFPHNQSAYESLLDCLKTEHRACIIHPTGTGKSFIGFKYCEDHPEEAVLWLSPSEYIFRTQCENLTATGAILPKNVQFCTYAKLSAMSDDEIVTLRPTVIIEDEFHRGGAPMWQQGLMRLLAMYPDAKQIGLTATSVRYLDSQRDMARELFAGNVASEMTLGEAIVRGILNPPTYVTALYSCCVDLERYERRVRRIGARPTRDAAERYLDALRRALEQADGLDVIFQKHITERAGKYLVFCANREHLYEMLDKAPEHFGKIDAHPHVYKAFYSDPDSEEAFQAFKNDQSDHLKLLYSIDMLNEGIHVEDIDGVILFRPTISPIIYKQQIGRALSAGKNERAVILDIVNNISSLYSIGAVQEEMDEIIEIFREGSNGEEIVHDRFHVIDELQDCRRLFEELEQTLLSSWETMYAQAKQYFRENGDLLPPASYVTEDGYQVGQWVMTQRAAHSKGLLSKTRIQKLDAIGMDWRGRSERLWEAGYQKAELFSRNHGHLFVHTKDDAALSAWLVGQRRRKREGTLSEEQVQRLTQIGMIWDFEDVWENRLETVREYGKTHGNLDIPAAYETEDGVRLGSWLREMRRQHREGTLSAEKSAQLEAIGVEWNSRIARDWKKNFKYAEKYYAEYGDLNVPSKYAAEDGFKLGTWISTQRTAYKQGRLKAEQIQRLEHIGMSWNRFDTRWEEGYRHAREYWETCGGLDIPATYTTTDGFRLGAWLAEQRNKYRKGKLPTEYIRRLEELGIVWNQNLNTWQDGYKEAKVYYLAHGNLRVPTGYASDSGFQLGHWIASQRFKRRRGQLSADKVQLLEQLSMAWEIGRTSATVRHTGEQAAL